MLDSITFFLNKCNLQNVYYLFGCSLVISMLKNIKDTQMPNKYFI